MFSLEVDGLVARITIARGEKRNAVPMACWQELEKLVRRANVSDAAVVVLQSDDEKSFCAGSDLSELHRLIDDGLLRRKFRGAMASVTARLRSINKPTIALVRGGCFGTGVSLAMACDIRITDADAEFAITPARFGISYPEADMQRLVQLVGPGHASAMVYSGLPISGTEAYRIGLAEYLDCSGSAAELVTAIAKNSRVSLYSLKAAMLGRYGADERFDNCFGSAHFVEEVGKRHA